MEEQLESPDYFTQGSRAHIERVAAHIASGMEEGSHPLDIAWAIYDAQSDNIAVTRDTRTRLLRECGYIPYCWICGLRIYLDAPKNDDASLTLDHVLPRKDGGTRNGGNIRLAHCLCNGLRHATKLKPRTKLRAKKMKEELQARMDREEKSTLRVDISFRV